LWKIMPISLIPANIVLRSVKIVGQSLF